MSEDENQPQAEETQQVEQVEAPESQVAEPSADTPRGEEEQPQPPPRTYTQEEWSAREAAKDREAAEYRQLLARMTLEKQVADEQAKERGAQTEDRRAVEEGEITPSEAAQRGQARQAAAAQQKELQQQRTLLQQIRIQYEGEAKILVAEKIGKEYEIDPAELLKDESLMNPHAMEAKAAKLALERTKAELRAAKVVPESFDSGQVGSTGASWRDLSPEEGIKWALEHPPKKKQ